MEIVIFRILVCSPVTLIMYFSKYFAIVLYNTYSIIPVAVYGEVHKYHKTLLKSWVKLI